MADSLCWWFPCLFMGDSTSPVEGSRKPVEQMENAVPMQDRPKIHHIQYRTSMAGSMYYSGASSPRKTSQTDAVVSTSSHGPIGATGEGTPQETKLPTANKQVRKKPARPGLTVCIPRSENTVPPVEKDHLSPDSALEDRRALEFAHLDPEQAGGKGRKPSRFHTFSEKDVGPYKQMTARTNPFDTPVSSKPSGRTGARSIKGNNQINLNDELALFSITSHNEALSAFDAPMSAGSIKAVSALRPGEKNTSVHDWAHEHHRDIVTRLTPGCLEMAQRFGQNGDAGSEPQVETSRKGHM